MSRPDPTMSLPEPPSKTRRKKEMHELQSLGERLVELSAEQLDRLPVPEDLLEAVRDWQRFTRHEAKRRQMQFIGRLMRDIDPAPIRDALAVLEGTSVQHKAWHKSVERWRDRLLAEPDAFFELARECPGADLTHLRQLARNAEREQQQGQPPRSFRALFRELKLLFPEPVGEAPAPEDDEE